MNQSPPSGNDREPRLVRAFVRVAGTLVNDYDVAEILYQLTEDCVDLLDAATAGLLLSDQRGSLRLVTSSSEETRLVELFQLQADEGPCLDAFRTGEQVVVADLAAEAQRWPRFVPKALSEGFAALHTVPLRLRNETIGTLNLFNQRPGALSTADRDIAQALADIATMGILQERAIRRGEVLTEQLQTALNSRVTIEQAKGVLAQAGNLDMDQAFRRLRGYSRDHNTRLSQVALQLADGKLAPAEILGGRYADQ